jgi:hypothetical protein
VILLSYSTPEYSSEVASFTASALEHHDQIVVRDEPSLGSWRQNVGMKPRLIIETLAKYHEPVLFVDIDARFQSPWDLRLESDYDFAAWFIPTAKMRPADRPGGPGSGNDGIASGTMWWNASDLAMEMLDIWREREKGQGAYGQKVLGEAWHDLRPVGLRTKRLPQRYCKVFDRQWDAGEEGPPVILHMQASRRLRSRVR